MQMTTSSEAAAFFVARAIIVAAMLYITPLFLSPIYSQLLRQGGRPLLMAATLGVTATTWLVTLVLFLALRAAFGAAPPIVAPSAQQSQFTSSGAEIGAYLLAIVVVMLVLAGFSSWVLPGVYAAIRENGRNDLLLPLSVTISLVSAVIFFFLFVALRGAMATPAGDPAAASLAPGSYVAHPGAGADMGFGGAIATCFAKYADFSGRAARPEYWYWVLLWLPVGIVVRLLDVSLLGGVGLLTLVIGLPILLPGLAVGARRLHDIDQSGWWLLIGLVPIVGAIALLVMMSQRGSAGANRFGPEP
jgi:uncharacterized membrane protein YhaH (DUF805 family)